MTDLLSALDVAKRGLAVMQKGVAVTGHNIANANTPGYSRQRQVLSASKALARAEGALPTGVRQMTIDRVTDRFIDGQIVAESSRMGSLETQSRSLTQIGEVLNEQHTSGITGALSEFYGAWNTLANAGTPEQPLGRAGVRAAGASLLDVIHSADIKLRDLQRSADRAMVGLLPEINSLAQRIAELNVDIVREGAISTPNDLLDQRDNLVRELASKIDIGSFEDSGGGVVVMVANGVAIVEGGRYARLEERDDVGNGFDPSYSKIYFTDGVNDFEITPDIGGGEIGGLLRSRDTHIANAIRALDEIAYNLADTVNVQHRQGRNLSGASSLDFFAQPAAIADAARLIQIDTLITADLDNIAAGGAAGSGLEGDVENAKLMFELSTASAAPYVIGDTPGSPTGSPAASVLEIAAVTLASIGQMARDVESARLQESRVLEALQDRRDEASGVSIDEEVTNLIRLQAAFQANARIISTVNQLLEDILNMV